MSKNMNFKLEVNEILSKSQKNLLERIKSFRLQIKEVRERELSKSLIPVHNHKPGTTVSAGTEDVPYGKLNPKGVNKNLEGLNTPPMPLDGITGTGKSEKCMKCGEMHKPLGKCGTMKSELVDEKGKRTSNSVNSPHPSPKEQTGDKGGIKLPGAKLKKALTAGMGSGVPSTKVNDLGKASGAPKVKAPSVAMAGNTPNAKNKFPTKGSNGGVAKPKVMQASPDIERKAEPPMAKPPSGKNMGTAVPTSTKKSELNKGMFSQAAMHADPVSAMAGKTATAQPKVKLPGAHLQAQRAQSHQAALGGAFQPKGPVNSGLELAVKPAAMRAAGALGLASPKAAGVTPAPPAQPMAAPQAPKPMISAAKPGIFGKIGGFRKP